MFRLVVSSSAALAFAALVAGVAVPGSAQDMEVGAMFGAGPDRICNVLMDSSGKPVMGAAGEGAVLTAHTFDCPEPEPQPVAQIAPAAPPPEPLPASGVLYFDFDKADLNSEASATLASMIENIKDRELGGITVAGHADRAGPPDYNMKLSQRRANTVAAELIKSGIPARIVTTEAYGETQPAVETPDGVPEQANRRVVVDFAR